VGLATWRKEIAAMPTRTGCRQIHKIVLSSIGRSSRTRFISLDSVLLTIAYDGSKFVGFAPQAEGRTVHGELTRALHAMDPQVAEIHGASRTDAGVHARGQALVFTPSHAIPLRGWVLGTNQKLGDDVVVRRARSVPRGFDLRRQVHSKRYRYEILVDPLGDAFLEPFAYRVPSLDVDVLRQQAKLLLGTHDFAAFRSSSDLRTETTRTIYEASVDRKIDDPRVVTLDIVGNRFMHNMVRIIAGTLIAIARKRLPETAIVRGFSTRDRKVLGPTAPACGLYLEEIRFDLPEGIESWP
jgi:tRNA pseudouridine38-40 synthase